MTILESDIKLMASERLLDVDDGGGLMSAVEVVDGVVNNLFPDISRLDRTYGRVNLRKAYAAVRTANRDLYYGSHAIITDAPDDGKVSVVMFTTGSYTDERAQAQDRIESYVVQGPESRYVLLGDQLIGQRLITVYARLDVESPEVGTVYLLSNENSAGTIIGEQQYVRVNDVSGEIREFEDSSGVFSRQVFTIEIGSALRRTFDGPDTAVRISKHGSPSLVRTTLVADASKYFGIVPLADAIAPGDLTIKAASVYGQLVPAATVESPVVDIQAGADRLNVQAASASSYSVTSTRASTVGFGRAVTPGSVTVRWYTSSTTYFTALDDGAGNIIVTSTASTSYAVVGESVATIDYATGVLSDVKAVGNNLQTTAIPGVAIYDVAHTDAEAVELANRGYNYLKTLRPIPHPGTLTVDYMVLGKWYRLRDRGDGVLEDDSGGTGTIDYATGAVVATLGALPDTGSTVIYTWATNAHYEIRDTDTDIELPTITTTVSAGDILPGSLVISWESGAVTKTATDDGAGNLIGDGAGRVIYGLGQIGIKPNALPDSGSLLQIDYDKGTQQSALLTPGLIGDDAVFTLANAPVEPKTFAASYDSTRTVRHYRGTKEQTTSITVTDDGAGNLSNGGTINYATGEVVLPVRGDYNLDSYIVSSGTGSGGTWGNLTQTTIYGGSVQVKYNQDSVLPVAQSETAALPSITFDLTPLTTRNIMTGSVEFVWNGKTYIDREGSIYTDLNRDSGAATAVGLIDYETGQISLDEYNGGANSVTMRSLLVTRGAWTADKMYFRTPGAPLRPASFYLRATQPDGSVVSATGTLNGALDQNGITGTISYQTGVADVTFSSEILPSTVKFNAVVYSMMPLDEAVLGLDPVRLPIDGRVPIIRNGDVVVVHSTQSQTLSSPLSAGETAALSRNELANASLKDQAGTAVDPALYSVNRKTGVITMADPLDLSAYTEPLIATHRIEDMALVNEAEINGTLRLVGAIPRVYDPADTFVSSALIFGDIGARVHHLFSQATWNSVWADQRVGSNTTAQYNDVLYPPQTDNKNAIRERWALIFTSSTTFNVVGEVVGQIASGNTATDLAPLNPATGEPYFTLYAAGWGSGWGSNNVLRFNTDAAHAPIWIARTTLSGTPSQEDDSFKLQIRGDAD
ncbi:hypothetical protein [Marinobacterium rhizophilum]|uniref:Uncharacterized protein n=1 Tax=Marinobacterium rhizophilum TaxID=420402 RepID=A0ABY5HLT5_9GAMM|nr:hypothetical protein [Marinobacterium rhizophilum]UTW12929.1 hypothetical protein KDW95_04445 [Marinobacterium rhizophilum]